MAAKILTISDGIYNGKGGNSFITFDYHCYIYECEIKSGKIYIRDRAFDLSIISHVIFNFNECFVTYDLGWDENLCRKFKNKKEILDKFVAIANYIKDCYPDIIIYQDPEKCFNLGDKYLTYEKIKNIKNEVVIIPPYKLINSVRDLDLIDFYPAIIKVTNGSNTKEDAICRNKRELIGIYNKVFRNKKNVFCTGFIDSFISGLDCFCCLRLAATNNRIFWYFFRPSKTWKIHTSEIDTNKIIGAERFFEKFLNKNINEINKYLSDIHGVFGNAFYAYDIIFSKGKLYICEIGLKIFDNHAYTLLKKEGIRLGKMPTDLQMVKKYYSGIRNTG